MTGSFEQFQQNKPFLVCVDSDGCAMDTMDIKHRTCFGPCLVAEWKLEKWAQPVLTRWNEINLYTTTRGVNRFKGLALLLAEVDRTITPIEDIRTLENWVARSPELSNAALQSAVAETNSPILAKALRWSRSVNAAIAQMPDQNKLPFPGALAGLAAAHAMADVAVVSSANRDAVLAEWNDNGLLAHVDLVLSQDAGSKAACIAKLLKKGYDPHHVLMVGDAPGDRAAAKENGVYFYPILVRHEGESWQELVETALPRLREGTYETYGRKKAQEFVKNLGG